MKLSIATVILTGLLFSQGSFADEKNNFSKVYKAYTQAQKAGDAEQTLKLAKQALTLGKVKFADDKESLTNLKFNLAAAYIDAREAQKAAGLYKEIRKDYKAQHGEVSEPYLFVTLDLLDSYSKAGWPSIKYELKAKRASSLLNEVMSITKKLEKKEPERAVSNYYAVAKVLFNNPGMRGNYRSVVKFTEKARDKIVEQFGENDLKAIETRYLAGRLNMTKGRYNHAVENLETIITTIETELDTSHPYELASHAALIEAYEKLGQSDKSTTHCQAIGRMTPWQDDVDPTPLYRVNPSYPISYARNGRDGYTKMTFDISESGFVTNIKVTESSGELFSKESIAALEKWRYAPKFENGEAITAEGLEVQLDYKIEN